MNILRKSQEVQVERYALVFEWKDLPGAGFSFTCDKQGTPLLDQMHPVAQQNLTRMPEWGICRDSSGRKGLQLLIVDLSTIRSANSWLLVASGMKGHEPSKLSIESEPIGLGEALPCLTGSHESSHASDLGRTSTNTG